MTADGDNVYGALTALDGIERLRPALEVFGEVSIYRSGYDGSATLRLRSENVDFETEPLPEPNEHLFNGQVDGPLTTVTTFVRRLSDAFVAAGIVHRLEVYDDAGEFVREWPVPQSEARLAKSLRTALATKAVGEELREPGAPYPEFLSELAWFVPSVVSAVHDDWRWALDGFAARCWKTDDAGAELYGTSWLLDERGDMFLAPAHVRWQIAADEDRVTWIEVEIGENDQGGMKLTSGDSREGQLLVRRTLDPNATIDWAYRVGFGERR